MGLLLKGFTALYTVALAVREWCPSWYDLIPGQRFAYMCGILLMLLLLQWSFVHREKLDLRGGVPGAVDRALCYQLSQCSPTHH